MKPIQAVGKFHIFLGEFRNNLHAQDWQIFCQYVYLPILLGIGLQFSLFVITPRSGRNIGRLFNGVCEDRSSSKMIFALLSKNQEKLM